MTAAPPVIPPKPPTVPLWKKHWKPTVTASVVLAGLMALRPTGDSARARAYAAMDRQGVSLTLIDGKLEHAKFELNPGIEGPYANLGWAFHQLTQFPEVGHVETKWFLSVNLSALRALKNLETFVTERAEIEDDDLAVFCGMRGLKNLTLGGEKLTPRGLKYLEGMPNLKTLRISGQKMVGGGFESLGRIPNLEVLSIEGGRGEWNESLSFGSPTKLKSLRLANIDLARGGTKGLDQLQALEELQLWNVRVDAEFLRAMSRLPRLKVLKLQTADSAFGDFAEIVAAFPSLRTLFLSDQSNREQRWITRGVMEKISQCRTLEELGVFGGAIGDDGLRSVAKLPRLRSLKLVDVGLTERSIPVFGDMKSLEELDLLDARLTPRSGLRVQPVAELRHRLEKKQVKFSTTFGWGGFW